MSKFAKISTIAVALAAVTGSVALANYGDDNGIYGKVRVNGTTQSVNRATVTLYTKGGHKKDSDRTNKRGKYEFANLTENKFIVKARATGFRNPNDAKKTTVSKTVKADGAVTKNLYLDPMPTTVPGR